MALEEDVVVAIHAAAEQGEAMIRDLYRETHGRPCSKAELSAWRTGFEMGMEGGMRAVKQMLDDGILVPNPDKL